VGVSGSQCTWRRPSGRSQAISARSPMLRVPPIQCRPVSRFAPVSAGIAEAYSYTLIWLKLGGGSCASAATLGGQLPGARADPRQIWPTPRSPGSMPAQVARPLSRRRTERVPFENLGKRGGIGCRAKRTPSVMRQARRSRTVLRKCPRFFPFRNWRRVGGADDGHDFIIESLTARSRLGQRKAGVIARRYGRRLSSGL
jgi:hypothetical protein